MTFTDQWGRIIDPAGQPILPEPGQRIEQAAGAIGAAPTVAYVHPLGKRQQPGGVFLSRNDHTFPTRAKPTPEPPADEDPADTSTDPPAAKPHVPSSGGDTTWSGPGDPRHGGPPTATSPPAA